MKLGIKYFIATFIILVIFILIIEVLGLFLSRQFLLKENVITNQTRVTIFAKTCEDILISKDYLFLFNYIKIMGKTTNPLAYAILIDTNSLVLAHSNPSLIRTYLTDQINENSKKHDEMFSQIYSLDNNINQEIIDMSLPVYLNGVKTGYVRMGFKKWEIDANIRKSLEFLTKSFLIIGLSGFIVTVILSFMISYNMTKRIQLLEKSIDSIEKGNLDVQIEIKGKDELANLAQKFNEMAVKLKEFDELKRDFVSSVTHELRSPIAAIESYINDMLDGGIEQYRQTGRDDLLVIKNNAMRLLRFINDLLDSAKIESGKFELNIRETDLCKLVESVANLYMPKCIEKKILLHLNLSSDLPVLFIDEDRTCQVLNNLIGNALKFTPENGTIELEAKVNRREEVCDSIEISVTDSGIGIPEDAKKMIFDKFTQVQGVRTKIKGPKGTGLGLHIAKNIVSLHGGKIWVESPPENRSTGSSFKFTLPCKTSEAA